MQLQAQSKLKIVKGFILILARSATGLIRMDESDARIYDKLAQFSVVLLSS